MAARPFNVMLWLVTGTGIREVTRRLVSLPQGTRSI